MGATTYPKTGGNAVEHMFQFPRQAARLAGRDRLTDGEVISRQTLKRTPSYEARAECCSHSTGLLAQIQRGVQVRHASVRGSAGPTTSNRKRLFWALPAPAYSVQRTTSNLVAPTLPSPNGSGGFSAFWVNRFERVLGAMAGRQLNEAVRNSCWDLSAPSLVVRDAGLGSSFWKPQ